MSKLLLTALLFSIANLQAAELTIINLLHQPAEDVIPLIRPVLANKGVITGSGYKLIIRATPQQLADIKNILKEIDLPVQQLLISVRQGHQSQREDDRQSIAGNIGNNKTRILFGHPAPDGGLTASQQYKNNYLQAQIKQRTSSKNNHITQQIRALSGRPAYISIGESRPVLHQRTITRGRQIITSEGTHYLDSNSGFYVIPRVHGNRISLHISAQQQQATDTHIDSSKISATVSGRLGEWIKLGHSDETSDFNATTGFQRKSSLAHNIRNVFVKVTRSP